MDRSVAVSSARGRARSRQRLGPTAQEDTSGAARTGIDLLKGPFEGVIRHKWRRKVGDFLVRAAIATARRPFARQSARARPRSFGTTRRDERRWASVHRPPENPCSVRPVSRRRTPRPALFPTPRRRAPDSPRWSRRRNSRGRGATRIPTRAGRQQVEASLDHGLLMGFQFDGARGPRSLEFLLGGELSAGEQGTESQRQATDDRRPASRVSRTRGHGDT